MTKKSKSEDEQPELQTFYIPSIQAEVEAVDITGVDDAIEQHNKKVEEGDGN